jgi:hypothetical protein
VERTWKPTTAGILSIIAGAFGLIAGIVLTVVARLSDLMPWHMWDAPPELVTAPLVGAGGAIFIILGIVAIVGGTFAIQRRIWGLALAGAICALIVPPVFILGILSIIFVAMSKNEFV